jgi:hypothetical protein|nr:MAG TPA: hypothetical protein [Caudoviricetes sp.]
MNNTPKPTPEFNQLLGEADYLMSIISLEIQRRINYFNPISEEMEIFEKLPIIKEKTHANLKFCSGNRNLKDKFKETLEGQQIIFGGYKTEKAKEISDRYDEIVEKRNKIFHSFPYSIDGKYVKKYRNLSKGEDIIIDEDFLRDFIRQCEELINILSNPDFNSVVQEFATAIKEQLNIISSAVSKFNLAFKESNMSNIVKMADLTKKISEKPTSHRHKQ